MSLLELSAVKEFQISTLKRPLATELPTLVRDSILYSSQYLTTSIWRAAWSQKDIPKMRTVTFWFQIARKNSLLTTTPHLSLWRLLALFTTTRTSFRTNLSSSGTTPARLWLRTHMWLGLILLMSHTQETGSEIPSCFFRATSTTTVFSPCTLECSSVTIRMIPIRLCSSSRVFGPTSCRILAV